MLNGTTALWECLSRRIAFTASFPFLLNNAYLVQLGKKKKDSIQQYKKSFYKR